MDLYSCRCKWDIFLKLNQIEEAFQAYLIGEVAHLIHYYISSDEVPAEIRKLGKRLSEDIWNTEDAITLMKKVVNSLQWGEKYKEINHTSVLEEIEQNLNSMDQEDKLCATLFLVDEICSSGLGPSEETAEIINSYKLSGGEIDREKAIALVKKLADSL